MSNLNRAFCKTICHGIIASIISKCLHTFHFISQWQKSNHILSYMWMTAYVISDCQVSINIHLPTKQSIHLQSSPFTYNCEILKCIHAIADPNGLLKLFKNYAFIVYILVKLWFSTVGFSFGISIIEWKMAQENEIISVISF